MRTSEILVVDPRGHRIKVYVREFRQAVPFSPIERKQVAYELATGERLDIINEDTFRSARTGAEFVRLAE